MDGELAAGQVRVTPVSGRDGWSGYLVEIGRARKVKQFFVSTDEAPVLVERLRAALPVPVGGV